MPTCFFHSGQRYQLIILWLCVFHTFKHLLGFISMIIITFYPYQLKTVAVLCLFWKVKKKKKNLM